MNGTMILARPPVLIKVTFQKHFALKVWVSIDHCCVNLGELYMILTVHGSDHKKSKCTKYHK